MNTKYNINKHNKKKQKYGYSISNSRLILAKISCAARMGPTPKIRACIGRLLCRIHIGFITQCLYGSTE